MRIAYSCDNNTDLRDDLTGFVAFLFIDWLMVVGFLS
jgi:hypothetical protein